MQPARAIPREASQGTRTRLNALREYNYVAEFSDMHGARDAMRALGLAGIEGEDVSLRGPGANEASAEVAAETKDIDGRILAHVGKYAAGYAAIGGVIGALLSPLILWAIVGLAEADLNARSIAGGIFLSILAFSAVGGLIGYITSLQGGPSWELAFHDDAQGRIFLAVHSDREETVGSAETVLREHNALAAYRVDARGRRLQ